MRVYTIGFFIAWFLAWCPLGWWQWWGLCLVLLMMLGYLAREYDHRQRLWLFGLVLMVGWVSHIYALQQGQKQLPLYLHKQPVLVAGCYQVLAANQWPLQLLLERPRILSQTLETEGDKVWQRHAFEASHMRLNIYDVELIKLLKTRPKGALVAMAVLKKPRNYQNPDGFDYVRWAQQQGQVARGYIKANLVSWEACQMGLLDIPNNWRQSFLQRVAQVPHDGIGTSLWSALAAGHSQGLEGQNWQVLHRTGTTHLLVISGLHIGLVAALLVWFGQRWAWLLQRSDHYSLAIWLAWIGALGYAIFSGWGLPAQRAMIMLTAIMLVNRLGVAWNIWQRLLLAWVVTLLLQPNSLHSPGFWYSYLAVANLALVWQGNQAKGWSVMVMKTLASQLALLAILAPVIAATTGGLSLIGPGLNLILIPLFGLLVVPVLLLGSLLLLWLQPTHIIMQLVANALDSL
ncbi:MAG: ComEC/Rec2 family competence protein, partial [Gammaproteobacteria bacterium]|nr:ComEC/Rec2 family competence protein [Gammaproteobacteria bacterium]